MTASIPTTNARLRADLGWEPAYPTVAAGLDAVVARWREDGALVETGDGYAWEGCGELS